MGNVRVAVESAAWPFGRHRGPLPQTLRNDHNPLDVRAPNPPHGVSERESCALEKPQMKYAQRLSCLAMTGIVVAAMTASGCSSSRWFENKPQSHIDAQPSAPADLKSAATYINGLCKMSREQRDTKVRELNEAVLPNHANISCGPGSGEGP
jgi:hypothetical protein